MSFQSRSREVMSTTSGNIIVTGDVTLHQDRIVVASGNVLTLPDNTDELVAVNCQQTLKGKTINGNDNTITDISGNAISGTIDASKIGGGGVSNEEFDSLMGVTGNIEPRLAFAEVRHMIFGIAENPYTTGAYKVVSRFIYPGSTSFGALTSINIITRVSNNTTKGKIRIYDETNNTIIAEKTGISDLTDTIQHLGTISNLPSGAATFEIQAARAMGGGTFYVSGGHVCT